MRLYEIETQIFESQRQIKDLIPVLREKLARAKDRDSSGLISWPELQQIMTNLNISGIGGDPEEVLDQLKNEIPEFNFEIEKNQNGIFIRIRPGESATPSDAKGPSIDQMANKNLELSPKI